ncbi:hypothetical protein [Natrialbaceae archaeon AArc-T1-2]|uniref:hypothetical protein n=1 Tax=Natrialbaceae archaeon AArc-T1-2 TaxID=3053904 RepID=UPI00255A93F8|nr:hypothetical protein [Natrialbaceae archaeon AArc-T1-2]WIV67951.1 hypothetical protein QQ977_04255 [Natrialbaceae archaeon AArc-T1-2]
MNRRTYLSLASGIGTALWAGCLDVAGLNDENGETADPSNEDDGSSGSGSGDSADDRPYADVSPEDLLLTPADLPESEWTTFNEETTDGGEVNRRDYHFEYEVVAGPDVLCEVRSGVYRQGEFGVVAGIDVGTIGSYDEFVTTFERERELVEDGEMYAVSRGLDVADSGFAMVLEETTVRADFRAGNTWGKVMVSLASGREEHAPLAPSLDQVETLVAEKYDGWH